VNNQVTVVFDGQPDQYTMFPGSQSGEAQIPQEIRVIFSDGCSADDKIKRMVDEMPARKNCVVVTDDKDIFLYARSLGTRVMSVTAFTAKTREFHGHQEPGGKYISLSRQEKINKELFQKWLGEKR
jgi:predicted RNA-binding protein with PIN domain